MVGEIRDEETAQMAIEASLTGHLVLSTLHTNSAAETVTRLLDMGMDPFNFADSLLGVLAQRLVRRLCAKCRSSRATPRRGDRGVAGRLPARLSPTRRSARPRDDVLAGWTARHGKDGRLQIHHSPGCAHCDDSGFRGRAGLHELMLVSRELRRLIQTGARAERAAAHARWPRACARCARTASRRCWPALTTIEEVRATSNV